MLPKKPIPIIAIVTASMVVACAPIPDQAEDWITCSNKDAGYTVTHPADWKTNGGDLLPPCTLFDPVNVEVVPGTEIPFSIAVTILKQDVPLDTAIRGYGSVTMLEQETLSIDGHRAVRMEFVDEDLQLGASTPLSYQYLVDLGGKTLEASTHALGEPAYSRKKSILDRIMRELRVTD